VSQSIAKREQRSETGLATIADLVAYTGFSEPELAEMQKQGGVAAGASIEGLITFCVTARAHGLDPRKRQCYWIQRGSVWSFNTGIDGFAAIADRSGRFGGIDPVEYHGTLEIPDPKNTGKTITVPAQAEACVWKLVGPQYIPRPFRAQVDWKEFYPGPQQGFMWRDKPRLMLGKCARAQALRMAFPEQLGDIDLAEDEMQRGQVYDVQERQQQRPVLDEPKARRTYDEVFDDEMDQARIDAQTQQARGVVQRANAAAAEAQRTADQIEHERQQRMEGVK
jgi:hypothetical protein